MRLVVSAGLLLLGACSAGDAPATQPAQPGVTTDSTTPRAQGSSEPDASVSRRVDPRRGGFELGFGEFAITLEADEIRPGPVTFVIRNGGRLVHGFEIKAEGDGDHSGHGGGGDEFDLEGEPFGPGQTVRLSTQLAPGIYEIECFVAEHDDRGMRATLMVRPGAPLVRVQEQTSDDHVEIADFRFSPAEIEIAAGTELTWSNADPEAHTVTADDESFDSGTLDPGARFSLEFARAGTFTYLCQIHPAMRGTVRVV